MSEIDIEAIKTFTDLELLNEYKRVASKLVEKKNEELEFIGDNPNRDFWSDEQDEAYDEILEEIEGYETDFYQLNKIVEDRI